MLSQKIPYRRTKHGGIIINSANMLVMTRGLFSEICNDILGK